jgi:hypothetical protein
MHNVVIERLDEQGRPVWVDVIEGKVWREVVSDYRAICKDRCLPVTGNLSGGVEYGFRVKLNFGGRPAITDEGEE